MAVLNAQYKHPSSAYSQGLKDLIDNMLKVNPAERPDIHKVCVPTSVRVAAADRVWVGYRNDRSCTTNLGIVITVSYFYMDLY